MCSDLTGLPSVLERPASLACRLWFYCLYVEGYIVFVFPSVCPSFRDSVCPCVRPLTLRGGRVVRWCWVNFQCRGRPTTWITVGQGRTALAVDAGGGCLDIFTLIYPFSPLSPSLWETAGYRLKFCLKGPLNPKQPTNQPLTFYVKVLREVFCSFLYFWKLTL